TPVWIGFWGSDLRHLDQSPVFAGGTRIRPPYATVPAWYAREAALIHACIRRGLGAYRPLIIRIYQGGIQP
ncbi:MAG: hypothetical protein J4G04_00130, partial [Nitrosopumilaceae archaeon]|nr:hypothetical protein [Nitrosopumilaceae archaeon]